MVAHSKNHGGSVHPEEGLVAFELPGLGQQRREVGAVEWLFLGFGDTGQTADRGKEIDGSVVCPDLKTAVEEDHAVLTADSPGE